MLSTLSSLLPSPLLSSKQQSPPPPNTMTAEDQATKKKDKKEKYSNETFIFVRPPPAKSNHPLNLQVQMVPPRAPSATTASRHSLDLSITSPVYADPPTTGETITPTAAAPVSAPPNPQRSASTDTTLTLTRTTSGSSTYTGSTSVASFSSVTSTASGRRTIIPLYNLQAHNVMTNVIVDAGTDAKIAKFQKRGMELIGLAVIEPIEVWASTTAHSQAPSQAQRDSFIFPGDSSFLHPHRTRTSSRPVTPDLPPHTPPSDSALSLPASQSHSPPHQRQHSTPEKCEPQPAAPSAQTRKRDIFGKLFKKKEPPSLPPPPLPSLPPAQEPVLGSISAPTTLSTASRFTRHFKRPSFAGGPVTIPTSPTEPAHGGDLSDSGSHHSDPNSSMLCPPVLGIQPSIRSPVIPPVGRPGTYTWIVRRWLKGTDVGLLSGVIGKLGHGSSGTTENGNGCRGKHVEVSFEWKRGRPDKRKKRKERDRKLSFGAESQRASVAGTSSNAASSIDLGGNGNGTGVGASPRREGKQQVSAEQGHLQIPERSRERGVVDKEKVGGRDGDNKENERERRRANRLSLASQRSITTSLHSEDRRSDDRSRERTARRDEVRREQQDGDEDSDPEDSETPWTCTLKIRRLVPITSPRTPTPATPYTASEFGHGNGGGAGAAENGEDQTVIRVKIGTMSQTPHHPKVVAMLKMPFPLPDVEIDALAVRKRVVMPGGVVVKTVGEDGSGSGSGGPLILTAEEIKDVVSSTGLWLVVREGFGGVGKVNRKGDGWRIRA